MLPSAVSVLVVAQSSSEIPEGLTNNPVYPNPFWFLIQVPFLEHGEAKGGRIGSQL